MKKDYKKKIKDNATINEPSINYQVSATTKNPILSFVIDD